MTIMEFFFFAKLVWNCYYRENLKKYELFSKRVRQLSACVN